MDTSTPTSKGDNLRRAGRSLIQFTTALVVTGVVTEIWNAAVESYQIDPFIRSTVTVLIGALVVYIQNQGEDKLGKGILLPHDRLAGGALLGTGIGAKQGMIVGDDSPYEPVAYVENPKA